MKKVYLDNAGTTKMDKSVVCSMKPLIKNFGNESSSHFFGRNASKFVENARAQVASLINANTNEIYFTSSGSEANSWAIVGYMLANKDRGNHLITTQIEHDSVLNACKSLQNLGFDITFVKVDSLGNVDIAQLENSITDKTTLISVMMANNEVGTIQNIEQIAKIAKKHNISMHTDAVQTVGMLSIDVKTLGVDMLTISAHKIYGPKGAGALYVKNGIKIDNIIFGGNQEFGKRGGTANTLAIVGFGASCQLAQKNMQKNYSKMSYLKKYFVDSLHANFDNIQINGNLDNSVPQILSVSFLGHDANIILIKLDQMGVAVSRGSACTAGSNVPSYVLQAMNLNDRLNCTIRFSMGKHNTKKDIDYTIKCLKTILNKK